MRLTYALTVDDRPARYKQLHGDDGWAAPGESVDEQALLRKFESRVLQYLGKSRGDARCLSDSPRIRELLAMLTWDGPPPEQTEYIGDLAEFKQRKVLPLPTSLVSGNLPRVLEPLSPEELEASVVWRQGSILSFNSARGGNVEDQATQQKYWFNANDVQTKGYSPGKGHVVLYGLLIDIDGSQRVFVQRLR